MRNKKSLLFVLLFLVFSFSPVLASKVWEGNNFQSSFNNAKNNYQSALSNYQKAREQYLDALNKYKALACKDENSNCQQKKADLIEKAKSYLIKIKDAMAKYLTAIKIKVENMNVSDEEKQEIIPFITKDLEALDAKEAEIANLGTPEQIKEFASNLKTFWAEEETKIKSYIGMIFVAKLETMTEKMEGVVEKIQTRIDELSSEKYDVAKIQASLKDIKDKLAALKIKIGDAEQLFKVLKYDDGKAKAKEASDSLKDIYKSLKSFVGEVNKNKLKKAEVSGTGTISIKGEGFVSLTGNGEVSGKIGDSKFFGTFILKDVGKDAQVDTFGANEKYDLGDGKIQYKNVQQIKISGSNIVLEITSQFIDISAQGKGTVIMRGDGLYKAKGADWTDISKTDIKVEL